MPAVYTASLREEERCEVQVVGLLTSKSVRSVSPLYIFLCIQFTFKIIFNQMEIQLIWIPLSLNQTDFAGSLLA